MSSLFPSRLTRTLQVLRSKSTIKILLTICLYIIVIGLIWWVIPEYYYVDWIVGFRPAVRRLFTLKSPYLDGGIYNPPWAFIFLIPYAILPPKIGAILLSISTLFAMAFIVRQLGGNAIQMIVFLTIPQFAIKTITNPNIDFLAAFGFILPPQIGLLFLAIKPQIGIGVAIFWFIEAIRRGGMKEVVRVFAPVTIALLISFVVFGPYYLGAQTLILNDEVWWNYGLWPYVVPIGFSLIGLALRKHQLGFSIASSPFLSPYVASYSWPYAVLGLIKYPIEYLASSAGLWVIYVYLRFQ